MTYYYVLHALALAAIAYCIYVLVVTSKAIIEELVRLFKDRGDN